MMKGFTRRQTGFTLVEMAVVLVIVGLLLGGLLVPLGTQMENDRRKETAATLDAIREALIGFAVINDARLPCADTNGDGREDCPSAAMGGLPYADLGVSATDAWGNPWRYAVTGAFTSTFALATAGTLNVADTNGCAAGTLLAANVPAVVISEGKTDYATSVLESENNNGGPCFTDAGYSLGAAPFDDLVVWISPGVLFNRLVAAGRLP
ncbi:MAG TPA: prepilin-type N-terminal cleavage/methylation domain-containing protein [Gammaproteobacteria bacterium]